MDRRLVELAQFGTVETVASDATESDRGRGNDHTMPKPVIIISKPGCHDSGPEVFNGHRRYRTRSRE